MSVACARRDRGATDVSSPDRKTYPSLPVATGWFFPSRCALSVAFGAGPVSRISCERGPQTGQTSTRKPDSFSSDGTTLESFTRACCDPQFRHVATLFVPHRRQPARTYLRDPLRQRDSHRKRHREIVVIRSLHPVLRRFLDSKVAQLLVE